MVSRISRGPLQFANKRLDRKRNIEYFHMAFTASISTVGPALLQTEVLLKSIADKVPVKFR